MIKKKLLTKTLKNYCDAIWEYDLKRKEVYIHYDKMVESFELQWHKLSELTEFYKKNHLFEIDQEIWDKYLSDEFLKNFCESSEEELQFFLRFKDNEVELKWHRIIIEKQDENSLFISAKDIYDEIKESSLHKTVNRVFDNIIYIDAKNANFIIQYSTDNGLAEPKSFSNYDKKIDEFIRKYMVEEEIEPLINNMKLSHVIKKLENHDEYILHATMHNGNGNFAYKKYTFSYFDKDKKIIILSRIDVSDIVKDYDYQIRQFKNETYRDALTSAFNRKYFEENLKHINLNAGIAIIDIDDFKICNDVFGHRAGDLILVSIAKAIKSNIKREDILIRYGGDEFLLVLPNATEDDFEITLKSILKQVKKISIADYPRIQTSVSIGGILSKNEVVEEAVNIADRLMYQAKLSKNSVVTDKNYSYKGANPYNKDIAKQQILIVDDSEMNREILSEMLNRDFRILEAKDGEECLDLIRQYGTGISLILLDIVMPVMNGFDVLTYMNRNHYIEDIPVVMISGEDSDASIRRCYELGVSDYISRPFDAKVVYQRVYNTIKLYSKQRRLISLLNKQTHDKEKNNRIMISILSQIVEFRNGESGLHVKHINKLTELLLERLMQKTDKYKLTWNDCSLIVTASSLHDIGKIGIDDKILNKPGKLTNEEFDIMKTHTLLGASMLKSLTAHQNEPLVKTAYEICRWHHERYDGRGYPDGLKEDEIPITAQVVSIADVYDALVSDRVYKKAFSHEKAIQMILNGECGIFNPLLIECLLDIEQNIKNTFATYSEQSKQDK